MKYVINTNRWVVLIASCLVCICIGSGFAWNINQIGFLNEAQEVFGHPVTETSVAITFTIYSSVAPISMILTGILIKKFGPGKLLMAGSLLFCLGIFLAGLSHSFVMLYVTYGIMAGFGCSAVYNSILANLLSFFRDRRGFVTGMMTATYGSSALICAPLMQHLIQAGGVLFNLRTMGIAFAVTIACSLLFIREDETGTKDAEVRGSSTGMLRDKRFPVIFLVYTAIAACGLMIISQSGSMASAIGGLKSPAIIIMALSIMNIFGRVFWGSLSDKIGRYPVLFVSGSLLILTGALLIISGHSLWLFVLCALLIVMAYGGCMGMFPALLSDRYGIENYAINYGIICIGYAIGSYIGPIIATSQFERTGTYMPAFLAITIMGCVAIAGTVVLMRKKEPIMP